jgi:hypothetical protein
MYDGTERNKDKSQQSEPVFTPRFQPDLSSATEATGVLQVEDDLIHVHS